LSIMSAGVLLRSVTRYPVSAILLEVCSICSNVSTKELKSKALQICTL
jgi:hypothetical protein